MKNRIIRVDYFHATVRDALGSAYRLLEDLSRSGVNLLAFNLVPAGLEQVQLVLFPEKADLLVHAAAASGLVIHGPLRAFLVQGDDELGALVSFHQRLFEAGINVYSSSGVADGRGGYGYLVHVRQEDFDSACKTLEI